MKIYSVGIIFKALLLVLTALTSDAADPDFSYWTGYCRVHQSENDGSSGDYYYDLSDYCPPDGDCYDYCHKKCTGSGDGEYGGYPGCKGFEVGNGKCEIWKKCPHYGSGSSDSHRKCYYHKNYCPYYPEKYEQKCESCDLSGGDYYCYDCHVYW